MKGCGRAVAGSGGWETCCEKWAVSVACGEPGRTHHRIDKFLTSGKSSAAEKDSKSGGTLFTSRQTSRACSPPSRTKEPGQRGLRETSRRRAHADSRAAE